MNELTESERLLLAVCYYGQYVIPMVTDKVDRFCALENAGVPFLHSQLNDRQIKMLENKNESDSRVQLDV